MENKIKILTWICLDGTVIDYSKYNKNSKKIVIQFKLSKQRKIDSLKKLLLDLKVPYTFRKATLSKNNKLQPYLIRIYGDDARELWNELYKKKEFPWYFAFLDKELTKILIDTIAQTDGTKQNRRVIWTSSSSMNAQLLFMLSIKHGFDFYENKPTKSGFTGKYNPSWTIRWIDDKQ